MYTSGTTGRPKGVMLTHDNLFWASIGLAHTIDWACKYRFLSVAPLFHIGGLAPIFGNVHSGCTTFFVPAFDPVKIWDVITGEKINFMMSVPAMLQFMLFAPDIAEKDLSALRHIVCGGSAVPQGLIAAYDRMGIKVEQVYGITEYSGAVTFWVPDMGMDKSDSAGKAVFHGQVKILRPDGDEEMPLGEVGEICCLGPQVFKGYWNNPEATAAVAGKGYYRSGDMGKIDKGRFPLCRGPPEGHDHQREREYLSRRTGAGPHELPGYCRCGRRGETGRQMGRDPGGLCGEEAGFGGDPGRGPCPLPEESGFLQVRQRSPVHPGRP